MKKTVVTLMALMVCIFVFSQTTIKVKVTVNTTAAWAGNWWKLQNYSETATYITSSTYTGAVLTETLEADVPFGTRCKVTLRDNDASGLGAGNITIWVDGTQVGYHTGSMATYYYFVFDALNEKQCAAGEVETFIKIKKYQSENIILDISGKGGSPNYFYFNMNFPPSIDQFFTRVKHPEQMTLQFTITDPEGYGMANSGTYTIYNKCEQIATGGSDFDISKTIYFNSNNYDHQSNVFEKVYGNELHDYGKSIAKVCQGGYVVAGTTGPENISPKKQMYLLRINSFGDTVWTRSYGTSAGTEYATQVIYTNDNSILVAGNNGSNIIILKTNSRGDSIWMKTFAGGKDVSDIIQTGDGKYAIVGYKSTGGGDVYLAKIDVNGNVIWEKSYGNQYGNYGYSVAQAYTGDYYICGGWRVSNATPWNGDEIDAFVLRTNVNGDSLGIKMIGGNKGDYFNSLIISADSNIVVAGTSASFNAGLNYYIGKLKLNTLDTLWTKNYGAASDGDYGEVVKSIVQTPDREYALLGYKGNWYSNLQDVQLVKLNTNGILKWQKAYGRTYNDVGNEMILSSDNYFVFVGESSTGSYSGVGRYDVYLVKADTAGCLVEKPAITGDTVFCSGDSIQLSASAMKTIKNTLYSWSNGTTGISSYIKAAGNVTVTATDVFGCSKTSVAFKVDTFPKPIIALNHPDTTICYKTSLQLAAVIKNKDAAHSYTYLWNNSSTGTSINVSDTGTFSVKVTDETVKCSGNSKSSKIAIRYPNADQKICMVTNSSVSGKNLVVWERTGGLNINSYHIYKVSGNNYTWIGEVPFDSLSVFTDIGSAPESYVIRYALSVEDKCGNESDYSPYHQTMLLQTSKSLEPKKANLIWKNYVEESGTLMPDSFIIYRGKKPEDMKRIGGMPYDAGDIQLYTDTGFDGYFAYYQVMLKFPHTCSPAVLKAESGPYSQSLSNIVEYKIAEEAGLSSGTLNSVIYPNPFTDNFTIGFNLLTGGDVIISATDATGKRIFENLYEKMPSGDHVISFSADQYHLQPGLLFIKISSGSQTDILKGNFQK